MGRKLMRVPLDFSWPKDKVWKGYINPYAKLSRDCTDCGKMGYSPRALQFHKEWYGYVEFDPIAYGATPITPDHPRIREFATMQVNRSPEHYMTPHERKRERENFQKAGVDLLEIYKTTEEYAPEHEEGIRWDDPALGIEWPVTHPTLSARDQRWPSLARI